jgi:hypothetical protein
MMRGRCLCGAVALKVREAAPVLSVCHCEMCRRWAGQAMMVFEAPAGAVTATGPIRRYPSSGFAERAFCEVCGSSLWVRDTGDGESAATIELMPGPFGAAADFPIDREIYADRAWTSHGYAGDHRRITRAAYEAEHPFVPEAAIAGVAGM